MDSGSRKSAPRNDGLMVSDVRHRYDANERFQDLTP